MLQATDLLEDGLLKALDGYNDEVTAKTPKDTAFDAIFSTVSIILQPEHYSRYISAVNC